MRQSKLVFKTIKNVSEDVKLPSHRLLIQAGYVRESAAGRYYYLPLGMRVRDKVVKIIEQEIDKTGALKIIAPVLHPLELWKETNRTASVGFELMKVKDRNESEFALGGTAEEMIVDLVRKFTLSYRDLPFNVYQFSQKFRDEMRARGGLLRMREFLMKDAYSFHADENDFRREYENMRAVYQRIFERMGLPTVVVESDNGYIGGEYCHELVVESPAGESKYLATEDGSYAAHEDVAKFRREEIGGEEEMKELQEVDAPRGNTMEDGVKLHNLPLNRQIKDVMYVDEKGRMILAVIRGDLTVNETKLKHVCGAMELRAATEEEIRNIKSEPGFISPVGINEAVIIVADESLRQVKNMYSGANKKNRDLLNINIDRDYKPTLEGDIALAEKDFDYLDGKKLIESRGIEVGNIFQLGYHYSQKMKASFRDKDGTEKFYYMGCYGIGIDRTIATIIEKYNDDKGIIWPVTVAPYRFHLLNLSKDPELTEKAEEIYKMLSEKGAEVLFDDRNLSPGEKFADADLIGIPWRVIISDRGMKEGKLEIKNRMTGEVTFIGSDLETVADSLDNIEKC
jgi:prolyl-tRNA synthetase